MLSAPLKRLLSCALAGAMAIMACTESGGVVEPDVEPPSLTAVNPANGSTDVAVTSAVTVTFSEAMNAGTVTGTTFIVAPIGGSPIAANVAYSDAAATLTPVSALAHSTTYSVTVTSGARDMAGNPLPSFSSTFTTAPAPDVTAPSVTGVVPANGASNVAINSGVVVTFSEAMNAATVNGSTVTLTTTGGNAIAAAVAYAGTSATLTPSVPLAYSTTYTLTVTNAAKDLAGNSAVAFSSTFTTAAAPDITPPAVTTVTPANGSSNVAIATGVTVSFSEAMNASSVTGATFTLTQPAGGAVAASVSFNASANAATLTPSSPLAYNTTYTVNVTSGAKDLAGNGLVAFSSTFTTAAQPDLTAPSVTTVNPANGAAGVGTGASVTVTFSEPMNAATITASTFTLMPAGGSPVAATIAYNNGTATLTPVSALSFGTTYTVSVSSAAQDLAGNGLVPFTSTFSTASAPDVVSPTVTAVTPANGATSVATSSSIVVTFSEAMNAATVTTSTFTLTPSSGSPVAATVVYNAANNSATLTPSSALLFGTTYTVNVTVGATDLSGNGLTAFTSSFTTVEAPVVIPPIVTSVNPVASATNVPINTSMTVTFSKPMDAATLNAATFTVTPSGGAPIAGVITYNAAAQSANFSPAFPLSYGTDYTINLTTGAKDVEGTSLTAFSSTFRTSDPPDLTAPSVTTVNPASGASGVAISATVSVTFSEAMNAATVSTSTFTLTPSGGSPIAGAVSYDAASNTAMLTPSASLAYGTTYSVTLSSGAQDLAGNGLIPFSSTFTTPAPPDLTAPIVTGVNPTNGSSNIAITSAVTVTFSEAMNGATITGSTFTITPSVAATVSYNAGSNTATLTPSSALAYNTTYTVNVTNAAKDLAGNGLVAFSSTFTTAAPPADVTPPMVISVNPANRSTGAGSAAPVRIQFSEPIDFSTVNASTFIVKEFLPTGQPVPGTRTYEPGTNTIVFTPSGSYVDNKGYNVFVTTGVTDLAGNPLGSQFESCFTIAAGSGTPISMTGFWAGNTSCLEMHIHLPMIEDSNGNLSLGPCVENFCTSYGVSPAGVQRLGGDSCPPSDVNPGVVYCAVNVVSITGTHSGNNVSFTWTYENGLTFSFTGVYAASSDTGRKFLNGIASGATLPAIATTFEREGN